MKFINRIISVPVGMLLGLIGALLFHFILFDQIQLLPIYSLFWKLGPGVVLGAVLGFYFPSISNLLG
jgi:hypothetical protein